MNRRRFLASAGGGILAPGSVIAKPEGRVAFVLGNAGYPGSLALETPLPDSTAIAARLRSFGFQTVLRTNLTRSQTIDALERFRTLASFADLVVFYFAGHGTQSGDGANILSVDETAGQGLSVMDIARLFSDRVRQKVFFIDACRTSPSHDTGGAEARMPASPAGLFVSSAAQPGQVAYDNVKGRSPYAHGVLHGLSMTGLDLAGVDQKIRLKTLQLTRGQQLPWSRSTLLQPVILNTDPAG